MSTDSDLSIVQGRYGSIQYLSNDDPIGVSLRQYGEWAQVEINFLCSLVKPGATIIDVGANIGTHTVAFQVAVGASGLVISYEPQPEICEILKRNAAINKSTNARILNQGAGGSIRSMFLPIINYAEHSNFGGVRLLESSPLQSEVEVEIARIDVLQLAGCDLIKIDAEGMEEEVVNGACETIAGHQPFLFLEVNDCESAYVAFKVLRQHDYAVFVIRAPAFNRDNFAGYRSDIFRGAMETSLLGVPGIRVLPSIISGIEAVAAPNFDVVADVLLTTPRYCEPSPRKRQLETVIAERDQLRKNRDGIAYCCTSLEHRLDAELTARRSLEERAGKLQADIDAIKDSVSWKIGNRIVRVGCAILGRSS